MFRYHRASIYELTPPKRYLRDWLRRGTIARAKHTADSRQCDTAHTPKCNLRVAFFRRIPENVAGIGSIYDPRSRGRTNDVLAGAILLWGKIDDAKFRNSVLSLLLISGLVLIH